MAGGGVYGGLSLLPTKRRIRKKPRVKVRKTSRKRKGRGKRK